MPNEDRWRKEPTGRGAGGVGWGWGVEDDDGEASSPLTTGQMREEQQRLLQEQEDGLEALSSVVSHQRRIASAIGTEVEQQNELLDDVTQRTDNTQNRLVDETGNIITTTRKSHTRHKYPMKGRQDGLYKGAGSGRIRERKEKKV